LIIQERIDRIRIALPKGKLLAPTSCFLKEIGLGFDNYTNDTRVYRLSSSNITNLDAKMFHEKDVPVQVAVGNYDLGICGLDWIEELAAKYPDCALVKLANLGYNQSNLYVAGSKGINLRMFSRKSELRIVSEYPNLAESFALNSRLKRFKIFPVWGTAEAYPPENADILLVSANSESELECTNISALGKMLTTSTFLIANSNSLQEKDLSKIISYFSNGIESSNKPWMRCEAKRVQIQSGNAFISDEDSVWLALPDGHQKSPTVEFLHKAELNIKGYSRTEHVSRPITEMDWLKIKVIRPQDMPQQVANGNFDLAITGRDWLLDHLYRFPSSPVVKVIDLGFGGVKIVAVISKELPVNNITELKQTMIDSNFTPLRVASEYINITDKYLCEHHISPYKVIPTWGATEVFLPEDADLLIENTQTGKTLETHNLKIIDTLFQSTACLIVNKKSIKRTLKKDRIASLIKIFRQALVNTKK
jgi:ATP phosphoribosyltransferase